MENPVAITKFLKNEKGGGRYHYAIKFPRTKQYLETMKERMFVQLHKSSGVSLSASLLALVNSLAVAKRQILVFDHVLNLAF